MPRYRRLPTVVNAEQWHEGEQVAGVVHGLVDLGRAAFYVETREGRRIVQPGDWIITEATGERSVVGDEAFRATYEPADAPAPR